MKFVQTIQVNGADPTAVQEHLAAWHAEQAGIAPGYEGARILADEGSADRLVIEVVFSSQDEANRNNERNETAAWAAKLGDLAEGSTFRNYGLTYETPRS